MDLIKLYEEDKMGMEKPIKLTIIQRQKYPFSSLKKYRTKFTMPFKK